MCWKLSSLKAAAKPVYALDENNRPWAYVRIADENILASPVHLSVWKEGVKERSVMAYTDRERCLLDLLGEEGRTDAEPMCPPFGNAEETGLRTSGRFYPF